MDGYPPAYLAHNLPLIVLSGLCPTPDGAEGDGNDSFGYSNGPLIKAQLPLVKNEQGQQILQEFLDAQGSDQQWNSRASRSKNGLIGFKVKAIGREFNLPARKADPPSPQDLSRENPLAEEEIKPSSDWTLHSPLSPLTLNSPLYPDGLMTPLWLAKHQERIPSILVAFFDFTSDSNLNSLNDNQLKSEINALKTALSKSEYKTRFAVVLLSDKTMLEAPDIEERLTTIRKSAGLDSKSGLFFQPPTSSAVEISSFVTSVLTALQPLCVEYYRDLSKHSRRKKNRGALPTPTIPPTRGTSHSVSMLGWGIRYEFKLGVFAEFRQEMETACRHYTSALESLLGVEGTFETTAAWSPRWDQTRLLADAIAFRIIRCLLWSQLSTTAVQSWVNYRDRTREIIDRRGKGSAGYGWEAWESRWARLMAELVRRADIPTLSISDSLDMTKSTILTPKSENTTYLPPEKSIPMGERLPPWCHLHHPGYWLRLSARNAKRRRHLALQLPEEDRTPPGQSPASSMSNRYRVYDTYLCPEPHVEFPLPSQAGFDHSSDIVSLLDSAAQSFDERNQERFADRVRLEIGREMLRKGEFANGLRLLRPVWERSKWRGERWWLPLFELTRLLSECARGAGDLRILVSTVYELHSASLFFSASLKLDLMKIGLKPDPEAKEKEKVTVIRTHGNVTSFLSAHLYFSSEEGNVGEPARTQLMIKSTAHRNTAPVTLSKVRAIFAGIHSSFEVQNSSTPRSEPSEPRKSVSAVSFSDLESTINSATDADGKFTFTAEADLTLRPGEAKIFTTRLNFRESGDVALQQLDLVIETESFHLTHTIKPDQVSVPSHDWHVLTPSGQVRSKRIARERPWSIEIKPKPPKMGITIPALGRAIYTDETVTLEFEILNGEDEEVISALDVRLLSHVTAPTISWLQEENLAAEPSAQLEATEASESASISLPGHHLPALLPTKSLTRSISFVAPSHPCTLILESKLIYFLPSDPTTPVNKTDAATLTISSPFEASYDFAPRVHPEPWPSFFAVDTPVPGLLQRWCLTSRVANFADEMLRIEEVELVLDEQQGRQGSISCVVVSTHMDDHGDGASGSAVDMKPRTLQGYSFVLDTARRATSKDQGVPSVYANLAIKWARKCGSDASTAAAAAAAAVVTSTLPVIPLQLSPLEPRVVAEARHSTTAQLPPSPEAAPPPPKSLLPSPLSPQFAASPLAPQFSLSSPVSFFPSPVPITYLTLTLENPTSHPLTFDLIAPSSESLAFSGPKQQAVSLLPYSRADAHYRLLPLVNGCYVAFGVRVIDRYFAREVPVLPGRGLRAVTAATATNAPAAANSPTTAGVGGAAAAAAAAAATAATGGSSSGGKEGPQRDEPGEGVCWWVEQG